MAGVVLKDILNLVYLAEYYGLNEVAEFWEEVVKLNNWHQHRIAKLIVNKLFGTISGKKIIVLGFSFKANTNDTRESAAIQICKDLLDEGATLYIHDPKVLKTNKQRIGILQKKMRILVFQKKIIGFILQILNPLSFKLMQ